MTHRYDLTIIVPGIRPKHWKALYQGIKNACTQFSFEVIFSSPYGLPKDLSREKTIKLIQNYGSPTRALHLATLIAEGKFITWLSDDARIIPQSIDAATHQLLKAQEKKDIICMRYREGECFSGKEQPESYWSAAFHRDLHLPGVDLSWKIAPVMLLSADRYRELGGLDHAFEHINFNVLDLSFRAQKNGSTILLSPTEIMNCDWDSTRTERNSAVIAAYHQNDLPLFKTLYQDFSREPTIDIENWRTSSPIWKRSIATTFSWQDQILQWKSRGKTYIKKLIGR